MTLSHSWGNGQPHTTMKSTLETRIKSIPLAMLPQVFQDTVFITRQLEIKYLWIDSLCMI